MSKGHLWHVFIVDVVVVDVVVSINLSEKRSIQKLRCLEKDETEAEVLLFQALCFISGVRFIKLTIRNGLKISHHGSLLAHKVAA